MHTAAPAFRSPTSLPFVAKCLKTSECFSLKWSRSKSFTVLQEEEKIQCALHEPTLQPLMSLLHCYHVANMLDNVINGLRQHAMNDQTVSSLLSILKEPVTCSDRLNSWAHHTEPWVHMAASLRQCDSAVYSTHSLLEQPGTVLVVDKTVIEYTVDLVDPQPRYCKADMSTGVEN